MSFPIKQEYGKPLEIQDEGSPITVSAETLNFVGAGVTASGNADVTVTIPGGGGVNTETPTGTVDGSNTAFTVLNTPKYIIIDDLSYFENFGYTLSGLNITVNALNVPTSFIRSVY